MGTPMNAGVQPCLCGSGEVFQRCCGPWLRGEPAPDAEALMRSRYSAYVLRDEPYLLATWHPETRPACLDLSADGGTRWLGLSVKRHVQTGAESAQVEFVARYRIGGRGYRMHETSRFVREDGRWFYVVGEMHQPA
ncbi:MAG: SEC-C domain-containing protein [Zoogloeaceae bacterium]|nr:SEC-C domain-containing protein [Zoogloeaceae bacterium]